jgi:hypothetical protein
MEIFAACRSEVAPEGCLITLAILCRHTSAEKIALKIAAKIASVNRP